MIVPAWTYEFTRQLRLLLVHPLPILMVTARNSCRRRTNGRRASLLEFRQMTIYTTQSMDEEEMMGSASGPFCTHRARIVNEHGASPSPDVCLWITTLLTGHDPRG